MKIRKLYESYYGRPDGMFYTNIQRACRFSIRTAIFWGVEDQAEPFKSGEKLWRDSYNPRFIFRVQL